MIGWTSTTWACINASMHGTAASSDPPPPSSSSDTTPATPANGPGSTANQTGRQSPPGWPLTLAQYSKPGAYQATPKVNLKHPDRYDREPVIYTSGFTKPPVPRFPTGETNTQEKQEKH